MYVLVRSNFKILSFIGLGTINGIFQCLINDEKGPGQRKLPNLRFLTISYQFFIYFFFSFILVFLLVKRATQISLVAILVPFKCW
jgi:hypothetical protein